MLLADARSAVMPGIEETVSRIAITLTGEMGGETFHETISGADMNITTDIEQVLLDALAGGRNKSYKTSLDIDYTALDQRIADINNALSFGPADATFTLTPVENGEPQLTYTEGTRRHGHRRAGHPSSSCARRSRRATTRPASRRR